MDSKFLQVAKSAAQEAEIIILKYHHADIDVCIKTDNSPISKADRESEKVIIDTFNSK
ncbi:hypothetical protein KKG41_03865 [Patescibacteria group bacterium]|nr:hypothetical protein [Patescibacteria group bacterium]MBU1890661.1 hypothetical protein [Patescibacteria group bacterium]